MKIDKTSAAIGASVAALVGAVGITYASLANAADSTPSPSPSGGSSSAPKVPGDRAAHMGAEKELTGDTAAKVKAAILKKYPGATIDRMSTEDPAEGTGAAYEAHIATADGKRLEVLLGKDFAITKATEQTGRGPHGRGGPGRSHNETELTGATAAKVKAAVLAKLPGATVERMSTEDPAEGTGAAYEAHVTKADGTHVEVLLDKSFKVLEVTEGHGPGGPGGKRHGGPAGAPGGTPSSDSTTESSYTTA